VVPTTAVPSTAVAVSTAVAATAVAATGVGLVAAPATPGEGNLRHCEDE
jgi:hypothetical protein